MRVVSLWGVNYRVWSAQGVWDGKSLFCPIQVSLRTLRKENYKNCPDTDHTEISSRGQFKLEPHPPSSLLGISFKFSDELPRHFYMRVSPRADTQPQREKEKDHLTVIKYNVLKSWRRELLCWVNFRKQQAIALEQANWQQFLMPFISVVVKFIRFLATPIWRPISPVIPQKQLNWAPSKLESCHYVKYKMLLFLIHFTLHMCANMEQIIELFTWERIILFLADHPWVTCFAFVILFICLVKLL